MPQVVAYHRPATVDEAVALLAQPHGTALAGGTRVNAQPFGNPMVAVDLQALGLSYVRPTGSTVRIGATATLQHLADDANLPSVLRELARREEPSTLRTLATVGGTIAAGGWESELLTGLLVCDAAVTLHSTTGTRTVSLPALLADCELLRGALITEVVLNIDGTLAAERTGRTPGDQAIVSAVARRSNGVTTVAASGVAVTPILVTDTATLQPPADFRGSSAYRKHVAGILVARVIKAVEA